MDNPLDTIRRALAEDRRALRAAVDRVPAELRRERPAADRWSVADVIEHLWLVEERVAVALARMAVAAPARTADAPPAETMVDRTTLQDRSRRVSAPESIQPKGEWDAEAAWAELERTRAKLHAAMDLVEGRDLTHVSRAHPVLGQLDGYQWLAALGGHEQRHAAQILEIGETLKSQLNAQ